MEEQPKRIRNWGAKIIRALRIWLIASFGIFLTVLIVCVVKHSLPTESGEWPKFFITILMGGLLLTGGWHFIRWLCRPGNKKRFVIGCGCLVLLLVLFREEENWRGKRAWDNFRHEWEAKGEKFDFKDFVPPPVPDDQNFAMAPVVASCYGNILDTNGNPICPHTTNVVNRLELRIYASGDLGATEPANGAWMKGTLTDLKSWQEYYQSLIVTNRDGVVTHEFPVPASPQSAATDVLVALGKYNDALKDLAEASRLPESRFPLNYGCENPAAILLPHLAALKMSSQALQLRALAELEAGQSAQACDDTVLIFKMTEKLRNDPMLIDHLVRLAMVQIAVQVVYEGLAAHRWTAADLTKLSAEIRRQNPTADCRFALRGEMAWQDAMYDHLRKKPEDLLTLFTIGDFDPAENFWQGHLPNSLAWWVLMRAIPPGWFYQNQANSARAIMEKIIPIVDETNRTFSVNKYLAVENSLAEKGSPKVFHFGERMFTSGLPASVRKSALCQATLNLAETGIALERCRLARGSYPESLEVLAPEFMAQVPNDPIDGKALKYRREADGQFVLYSVGWNQTDDGGVGGYREYSPHSIDQNKGDWVWRYPKGE